MQEKCIHLAKKRKITKSGQLLLAGIIMLNIMTDAVAQERGWNSSLRLTGFSDSAIAGDAERGMQFSGRAGALSGYLSDIGINNNFMRKIGNDLTPGSAALFVLMRKASGDKVMERLKEFSGTGKLIKTTLSKSTESELRNLLENKGMKKER